MIWIGHVCKSLYGDTEVDLIRRWYNITGLNRRTEVGHRKSKQEERTSELPSVSYVILIFC